MNHQFIDVIMYEWLDNMFGNGLFNKKSPTVESKAEIPIPKEISTLFSELVFEIWVRCGSWFANMFYAMSTPLCCLFCVVVGFLLAQAYQWVKRKRGRPTKDETMSDMYGKRQSQTNGCHETEELHVDNAHYHYIIFIHVSPRSSDKSI